MSLYYNLERFVNIENRSRLHISGIFRLKLARWRMEFRSSIIIALHGSNFVAEKRAWSIQSFSLIVHALRVCLRRKSMQLVSKAHLLIFLPSSKLAFIKYSLL